MLFFRKDKKLKDKVVLNFTLTMTELLKSGVNLQQALEICLESDQNHEHKEFCKTILNSINEGNSFSIALKRYELELGRFYLELISLGEKSNCLTQIMENLCEYLKAREKINSKIHQALIYPSMIGITSIFVAITIVFVVFPKIKEVFEIFTESSQAVTQTLDSIKLSVLCVSIFLCAAIMICLCIVVLYKVNQSIREKMQFILIKLPVIGKLVKTICTRDFVFVMKLMCRSGLSFTDALKRSSSVIRNSAYRKELEIVNENICNGEAIVDSFKTSTVFPRYMITWLSIAVSTGNLESVFTQINDYYSSQVEKVMEEFMSLIEPTLILVVGIFMFYVVMQFVLPVFSLLGSI